MNIFYYQKGLLKQLISTMTNVGLYSKTHFKPAWKQAIRNGVWIAYQTAIAEFFEKSNYKIIK